MRLEKATLLLPSWGWLLLSVLSFLLLDWRAGMEIQQSAISQEMAEAARWNLLKTAAELARIPVPGVFFGAFICSIKQLHCG